MKLNNTFKRFLDSLFIIFYFRCSTIRLNAQFTFPVFQFGRFLFYKKTDLRIICTCIPKKFHHPKPNFEKRFIKFFNSAFAKYLYLCRTIKIYFRFHIGALSYDTIFSDFHLIFAGMFIATAMHYFYLVSFFWLNVMTFDVCRQFVRRTFNLEDFAIPLKHHHSKYRFSNDSILIFIALLRN